MSSTPHLLPRCLLAAALGLTAVAYPPTLVAADPSAPTGSTFVEKDEESAPHPADVDMWSILREMRVKPLPPLTEIVPRLTPLAHRRLPSLFAILETRVVPGFETEPSQQLSIPQEELIFEALRQLSPTTVLGEAARRMEVIEGPRCRGNAIRIAGAVGGPDELPWMLGQATKVEEDLHSPIIHRAIEEGFGEIMRRHPVAIDRLVRLQRNIPDEFMPSLLAAVGATGNPRAFDLLGEVISWRRGFVRHAISQVPRIGASEVLEANEALAERIRPFLDPADVELCQAAALALGELMDFEATATLIDLLLEDSEGLRQNGVWALRRITGLPFPENADTWTVWFREESEWARRKKTMVLRMLASKDDIEVIAAIQDASYHPLFRHELSRGLCGVLDHPRVRLRILAIRTLERLSSPAAIFPLVVHLDDRDEDVGAAALQALRSITGRDLPGDRDAWRTALPD